VLVLLQNKFEGGAREVRTVKRKRLRPVRGCGVAWSRRISEFLPAAMANSGEKFCRPGGFSGSRKGGELERRQREIYRRGRSSVKAGNKRN
jgi:hypothetical protein